VINWLAIGFNSADATKARFMRWAATWLSRRERARAAFLCAVDLPFAGLALDDLAAGFFAAGFFLAGVVVVGVEGEAS